MEVGDRVRGRFTGRLGVVTRVALAGVYVQFDGEAKEDPTMFHRWLHLEPVELPPASRFEREPAV